MNDDALEPELSNNVKSTEEVKYTTIEEWVYANKEIMDAVAESYGYPERLVEWDRSMYPRE
jgi:hypothetical protein